MLDPVAMDVLGIAGDFFTINDDVVASLEIGIQAHGAEYLDDGLCVLAEIDLAFLFVDIFDKGEVQVAQIMEDCTAAGKPSDHINVVFLDVFIVDLSQGVLVVAHDDRGSVTPEHETIVLEILDHVFFGGQVEMRVCVGIFYADHILDFMVIRLTSWSKKKDTAPFVSFVPSFVFPGGLNQLHRVKSACAGAGRSPPKHHCAKDHQGQSRLTTSTVKCSFQIPVAKHVVKGKDQVTKQDPEQCAAQDIQGIMHAQVDAAIRNHRGP